MTTRVLKKRSKQALAILVRHYGADASQTFVAEGGACYHGVRIRCSCPRGRRGSCHHDRHPLKGTPMFGGMGGGEQPEWSEETAYEHLVEAIRWSERPATMTDREWARTLRIARVKPFDREAFDAEIRAMDAGYATAA